MGGLDVMRWVVNASKMELGGLIGAVEFKDQFHIGKACFVNESQCPGDKPEIVSVVRGWSPFFQ